MSAGVRRLGLQDAPEHGFGGRGGYHASGGAAGPDEPSFAAPHRARTFADYEAEHGRGGEVRRGGGELERGEERRGSLGARWEEEGEGEEEERGVVGLEGTGRPGFGGRGGYQRPG